jgi:hypothetical protein
MLAPAPASDVPQPNAPAPTEDQSLIDQIMNTGAAYLTQAGVGARRGVSALAGAPADLVNIAPMLANVIPGVEGVGPMSNNPVGGSQFFDTILSSPQRLAQQVAGLPIGDPEPQGAGQRLTRRVGEELGAAAIPAAGALAKAARVGVEGARELGPLARAFVEPAAVNPRKFMTQEVAAAGSAGAGAGVAREIARPAGYEDGSTGSNVADLVGQILGAAVPSLAGAVGGAASTTASALIGNTKRADNIARDVATETIVNNMRDVPTTRDGIPDTSAIADLVTRNAVPDQSVVPGLQYSLSDVIRDPGVQALEYGRSQSSSPSAGRYVQRRADNAEAVDQAMGEIAPTGNPGALRSDLMNKRDAALNTASRETDVAQQGFDNSTRGLQPLLTADARGSELRFALQDASDTAKSIASDLWRPLNNANAPVPTRAAQDAFDDIDGSLSLSEYTYGRPGAADIPAKLADQSDNGMTTMRELAGLRSALTSAERQAANAGDPNAARIARMYRDRLDTVMEANIPTALRDQYAKARTATRDYKDRFTRSQTEVGRALAKRDGSYRTPDSSLPGKFVQEDEGNIASFQALMRETGNDARTRGAVRDQMLSDISKRDLINKPDQLDAYLGRYKTVLDEFPDLRNELTDAGTARRNLADYQAKEADLQNLVGPNGKGAVAEYLKFGGDQAERALKAATSTKDPGKATDDILNFVNNNPDAVEGARRVMWERLAKEATYKGKDAQLSSGGNPWSGPALAKFMSDPGNAAVLKRLYRDDPEQLKRIASIAEIMRTVDTRGGGKASASSGTAQGMMANAPTYESVMSRVYNVERGVVSPVFAATNLIGIWARKAVAAQQKQAVNNIIDEALLNPKFAAMLLKENNPANRAAMRRMGAGWKAGVVNTLVDILEEEAGVDKDAGLKKSIMGEK